MKLLLLSLLMLVISPSSKVDQPEKENCVLRSDGLYTATYKETNIKRYLRFYEDGEVISTDSDEKIKILANWFHKERTEEKFGLFSRGEFKHRKCKVKFELEINDVIYKFKGEVEGDKLTLEKTDKDGRKTTINYTFTPVNLK